MNPAALIASIQISLLRTPLLRMETVQDCVELSRAKVNEMIESGELPFAFNMAVDAAQRPEPRIFALCVAEKTGFKHPAGQTRNFQLPEVIGMILPQRDVRSTELERLLACSHQHVYRMANNFTVARKPKVADGPNSYTVFHRASVAQFLAKRWMT